MSVNLDALSSALILKEKSKAGGLATYGNYARCDFDLFSVNSHGQIQKKMQKYNRNLGRI